MSNYPDQVTIEEQGLRDGFQNEKKPVPTEMKLQLIEKLISAGLKRIQVASFVHPKLVPQMADAEQICRGLKPMEDIIFSGLVLNAKGMERAADAGLEHVAASISVSDTHSRKNANVSLSEARKRFAEMIKTGQQNGLKIRGGLQCAFGCRFEGRIDPEIIFDVTKEQLDLGVNEIALADTTGMADPRSIMEICVPLVDIVGDRPLFLHLHDTEGKGLANVLAALHAGVSCFDTAFGGMGGCPFIKGASGNISTEDLAFMLSQMGIDTGLDIVQIAEISRSLEMFFEKRFSGKIHKIIQKSDIKFIRTPANKKQPGNFQ